MQVVTATVDQDAVVDQILRNVSKRLAAINEHAADLQKLVAEAIGVVEKRPAEGDEDVVDVVKRYRSDSPDSDSPVIPFEK